MLRQEQPQRRSAQTALFLILDTLTKMFAPILAFTCDEIWLSMPHRGSDDARNVVLNEMNKPFTEYALDDAEMAKWDALISVRNDVNGVLAKSTRRQAHRQAPRGFRHPARFRREQGRAR
ncbi:MAG: class I tRNA ligase family protein [Oscillospiraceae bacterium]